jgi:hypothetical protein
MPLETESASLVPRNTCTITCPISITDTDMRMRNRDVEKDSGE